MAVNADTPDSRGLTTRRPYYKSSSFVIAMLFSLLLSGAVVFLGFYLYWTSRDYFIETTVANIKALIAGITVLESTSSELRHQDILNRLSTLDNSVHYQLYDRTREVLFTNFTMPPKITVLVEGTLLFDVPAPDGLSTYKVAARIHTLDDGMYLLIGRDISSSFGRQSTIELLIWGSIFALLLLILFSFVVSRFVVKRIDRIAQTAARIISTGDLSERISISSRWDDLSRLADLLNLLLQRIEKLVQGVRQVSNSIAHDLRTPLTHMRNRIEEQERRTPSGQIEQQQAFAELGKITDNLLFTFNSLLRIASIENARQSDQFQEFSLDRVVEDAADLYHPFIEERGQQLCCSTSPATMLGDQHLIFQMLANLIDNAIKYSPVGATITLEQSISRKQAHIVLVDEGPGIDPALHNRVFERFFRVDASRNPQGDGLGLALVDAVVALHKGSINLSNLNPGLRLDMYFPLWQTSERKASLP